MTDINGYRVRDLDRHADERGHLAELWRDDWPETEDELPAMAYCSVTYPGIVRAWHRHTRGQTDYWTVPQGAVRVGVYDDRDGSPTRGELVTTVIGRDRPALMRIPGACWHGFKAVGDKPALLLNFPTHLYDYDDPDEERLPWDTDRIPLDWMAEPHE